MMVPEELLEQAERGNVLIFVGEGINDGVLPSATALMDELAIRCDYPADDPHTLTHIAGYYELTRGRHGLVQFLRDRLDPIGLQPSQAHQLVAQLPARMIISVCYDRLLERALQEAHVRYTAIVGNTDVAYAEDQRVLLVWLWGVLDQPDSLVITEDDRRRFLTERVNLSDILRGELARRTWLFLGFDAADDWFRGFYDTVSRELDRHGRRTFLVGTALSSYSRAWWDRRNAEFIPAKVDAFLLELIEALAARRQPAPNLPAATTARAAALPERPYKLLDYYEAGDTDIFFGRQQEIQSLSALIHAHRLVLVYGASGVGKTSLLLAGALPPIAQADPPYLPIYVRALEDPSAVIRRTLLRRLPDAGLPHDRPLVDFLAAAVTALGGPFVIVLDQFEEFFIRLSPRFRAEFIAELGALYDARDVPVKVVISLREDWLAVVGEIEQRIPEVFRVRMRLLPFARDQAREAITAPVARLNVHYEPALLERLLDDLIGSGATSIMPPQLQLVCSALYNALKPNERLITLAMYEQLGGARGVLQQYLDDELARLARDDRVLARSVLTELVTSQGTKAVKTTDELALALGVERDLLAPVLELLVRARLLRALERDNDMAAYELAHEYLIREIELSADTRARKQAEELIKQEVENWQRFGTLLAADKLALINETRAVLRLNPAAQELLLLSALEVDDDIPYWLNRLSDPAQRAQVLAAKARTKVPSVRRRVARVLGSQDVAESVEPLLELATHDSDLTVRSVAQDSVPALTGQRTAIVARLQQLVTSDARAERRAALTTLAQLPLRELPFDLRPRIVATRVGLRTVWLIGQSTATPLRRALSIVAGLVLCLTIIGYIVSLSSYTLDLKFNTAEDLPTLIIRQGNPWIPLPGLSREVIDTGISTADITDDGRTRITNKELSGFWTQNGNDGYRRWGQDVLGALRPSGSVPMLWYLGQPDKAHAELLLGLKASDAASREWAAQSLGAIGRTNPALIDSTIVDQLRLLLQDKEIAVRKAALTSLQQIIGVNPLLMRPELPLDIMRLLQDTDDRIRSSASNILSNYITSYPTVVTDALVQALAEPLQTQSIDAVVDRNRPNQSGRGSYDPKALADLLEQIVQRRPDTSSLALLLKLPDNDLRAKISEAFKSSLHMQPALATPERAAQLVGLLQDQSSSVRSTAIQVLVAAIEANPSLASPDIVGMLKPLVAATDRDLSYHATLALGQLATANPALASQMLALLRSRIQDNDKSVRGVAAVALCRVLAAGGPLASDQLELLRSLLRDPDAEVRAGVLSTLADAHVFTSDLATPELAYVLRPMLFDPDETVRANATKIVEIMLRVNPGLATPDLAAALRVLLHDPNSSTRPAASSALNIAFQSNASLISPYLMLALRQRLENRDIDTDTSAAQTLSTAIEIRPAVATAELIAVLKDQLKQQTRYDRFQTAQTLVRLGIARPDMRSQIVTILRPLLEQQDNAAGPEIARALALEDAPDTTYAELKPAVQALFRAHLHNTAQFFDTSSSDALRIYSTTDVQLGREAIAVIREFVSKSESSEQSAEFYTKYRAISYLGQLGITNPALTAEAISALELSLHDLDSNMRTQAGQALIAIAATFPERQPEIVALLQPVQQDMRRQLLGQIARFSYLSANLTDISSDELPQKLLQDSRSDVRALAAYQLRHNADNQANIPSTLAALRALLRDPDAGVRYYALESLQAVGAYYGRGSPETIAALVPALQDPDSRLRATAANAIEIVLGNGLGSGYFFPDDSSNPESRSTWLSTPELVGALLPLLSDQQADTRLAAIYALRMAVLRNPSLATPDLLAAMRPRLSDTASVVGQAATAMLNVIQAANPSLAREAATALRAIRPQQAAAASAQPVEFSQHRIDLASTITALLHDDSAAVRLYAASMFTQADQSSVLADPRYAADLRELLGDRDAQVRKRALQGLANIITHHPSLAVSAQLADIRALLRDPDAEARAAALNALSSIAKASDTPVIDAADLQALLRDQDANVRLNTSQLLVPLLTAAPGTATSDLVATLAILLGDQNDNMRLYVVTALGQIGVLKPELASQVVGILRPLINKQPGYIQAATAGALGELLSASPTASPEVATDLLGLLKSPDSVVRSAAAMALLHMSITQPPLASQLANAIQPWLQENDNPLLPIVADLFAQLAEIDHSIASAERISNLDALLTAPNSYARLNAVDALGQFGKVNPNLIEAALARINPLVQDRDQDAGLRRSALNALCVIGGTTPELAAKSEVLIRKLIQDVLLQQVNIGRSNNPQQPQPPPVELPTLEALIYLVNAQPAITEPVVGDLSQLLTDQPDQVHYVILEMFRRLVDSNATSAQQIVDVLAKLRTDPKSTTRVAVTSALVTVAKQNPAVVAQVTAPLMELLADPDSGVSSIASNAWSDLLRNNGSAGGEVVNALIARLNDPDKRVRYFAAITLIKVAGTEPAQASRIVEALVKLDHDPDKRVRNTLVESGSLFSNPITARTEQSKLQRQQITEALVRLARDADREVAQNALDTLALMLQSDTAVVPASVGTLLISLLAGDNAEIRLEVTKAFERAVALNPALATGEAATALTALLQTPDKSLRSAVIRALGRVLAVDIAHASPAVVSDLRNNFQDQGAEVRAATVEALARIYAAQARQPGATLDDMFDKLADATDRNERSAAARALLLTSLNLSADDSALRDRLAALAVSNDPFVHIWSQRAAALLDITDMAYISSTVSSTPDASVDDPSSPAMQQLSPFVDQDFSWAATEASAWLSQRTN